MIISRRRLRRLLRRAWKRGYVAGYWDGLNGGSTTDPYREVK